MGSTTFHIFHRHCQVLLAARGQAKWREVTNNYQSVFVFFVGTWVWARGPKKGWTIRIFNQFRGRKDTHWHHLLACGFFLRSTRVTRPWRSFWKAPVRSVLPTSRASWTSRTAKRIRPATEGREGGRCGFKSDDATAKPKWNMKLRQFQTVKQWRSWPAATKLHLGIHVWNLHDVAAYSAACDVAVEFIDCATFGGVGLNWPCTSWKCFSLAHGQERLLVL